MKKILVVDDEKRIVEIIKAYLEREGYEVVAAYDGNTAIELARSQSPDLIILDLMLPQISGWDVCRILRKDSDVPIIMVTARDEVTDKIVGLEIGADDYLSKPFDTKELVARVKAVFRRTEKKVVLRDDTKIGDIRINAEKRQVWHGNEPIELYLHSECCE